MLTVRRSTKPYGKYADFDLKQPIGPNANNLEFTHINSTFIWIDFSSREENCKSINHDNPSHLHAVF